MKLFMGRKYYKPWVELYNFTNKWFHLKNDRALLKKLMHFFSCLLEENESLYMEYYHDRELVSQLEKNNKVEDTFLGKILKEVGFKKFRDWYFPEGMWEGGQKIEAWK